jgi:hypothetical protein
MTGPVAFGKIGKVFSKRQFKNSYLNVQETKIKSYQRTVVLEALVDFIESKIKSIIWRDISLKRL